ncbi:S8/S53 family peptidase [Azospirillum sp. TSO22-1]|uniref:S8/S53 family peptidase n=1 Tax=Azospirillum sp. TSO22-1 TaxID=716789 RepID=UPI000D646827|nr:S8/S53 family peptidase [Azospirillum sp. TSO22-1]
MRGAGAGAAAMWTVAVLDQGISNWFERTYKRNVYEYDVYDWDSETDYGEARTHGTLVAMTAFRANPALGYIDLKIVNNNGRVYNSDAELALSRVIALSNSGYQIGAINLSWGGFSYPWSITNELSTLASRGIFAVAASGNDGSPRVFEAATYPAGLSNVIAVGSHDGGGTPTSWSRNDPSQIVVLAQGENMPEPNINGTSFAAPQVAATVASIQAYASSTLGRTLTLDEMKWVLQQGGNGPRSKPDPADGVTRYFLYDHNGSVRWFLSRYLGIEYDPSTYLASYADLSAAFGRNTAAANAHFFSSGLLEGRRITFDPWSYLATYADLRAAFGANAAAATDHYLSFGRTEGRSVAFDGTSYLAANPDLIVSLGTSSQRAARHYVTDGARERRSSSFDAMTYLASYGDLITTFGTNTAAATQHFVTYGYREGRRNGFDALSYIASYADLMSVFRTDTAAATRHYVAYGYREGRRSSFDALAYVASYRDLIAAFGTNAMAATLHYLTNGAQEGRRSTFSAADYLQANPDLASQFGANLASATLHYVQTGWRENRPTTPDPATLSVSEGATDLPATTATSGVVAVGGRVAGTFAASGFSDGDWYRVRLTAGQAVQITLTGNPTGSATLGGPYLYLYSETGSQLAYRGDDTNTDRVTLTYTATRTGNHFIGATGYVYASSTYSPRVPQPYTLTVSAASGSAAPADMEAADAAAWQSQAVAAFGRPETDDAVTALAPASDADVAAWARLSLDSSDGTGLGGAGWTAPPADWSRDPAAIAVGWTRPGESGGFAAG